MTSGSPHESNTHGPKSLPLLGGTLTNARLLARLKANDGSRLIISPLLSPKQVGGCAIDVRLANQFIVFRLHAMEAFDPFGNAGDKPRHLQERQIVRFGQTFVLHPGMLALGSTLEYVALPNDLECQVEGRSSWARVGLQIATASPVDPGFKGVVTLELSNVGASPLVLRPGQRVAQLVFRDAQPPIEEAYGSNRKYRYPVGPEFSRLSEDKDGRVFLK